MATTLAAPANRREIPPTPPVGHCPQSPSDDTARRRIRASLSSLSVVSFLCGLVGLLVGNLVLGPAAILFGITALRSGTARRGRAALGIALGVADLVGYAFLVTHSGGSGVTWHYAAR